VSMMPLLISSKVLRIPGDVTQAALWPGIVTASKFQQRQHP
jgi:hypothetical protein